MNIFDKDKKGLISPLSPWVLMPILGDSNVGYFHEEWIVKAIVLPEKKMKLLDKEIKNLEEISKDNPLWVRRPEKKKELAEAFKERGIKSEQIFYVDELDKLFFLKGKPQENEDVRRLRKEVETLIHRLKNDLFFDKKD